MSEAKKKYGFETDARRIILSPEHELESLPGYRIRARKFTITAEDELAAARDRKRLTVPPRLRGLAIRAEQEKRKVEDIAATLPPAELDELLGDLPSDIASMTEIMRLTILHGLGEHNFEDQNERSQRVTPELVERILDYAAVAKEVAAIIGEWNAPLALATSAT